MNLLDINDLASANRINEDNAALHQTNVHKLKTNNPNNQVIVKSISTTDGEKLVNIDKMPVMMSQNHSGNIESHLLSAVQEPPHDSSSD
jgi:hypothetical protein